jgi:hypothetical protein
VRIRIALPTAVAVLVIPAFILTMFSTTPAASAKTRLASAHRVSTDDMKLMSYSEAQKVAKLATYYDDVTAHQEAMNLEGLVAHREAAFLEALVARQQAAAAAQANAAAQRAATAAAAAVATPAPAPAPATAPGSGDASSTNTADWACIRAHESGDNYSEHGGGAYQFELGTWRGLTGLPAPAEDYPASVQDAAALRLYAERGWEPWTTRYVCGL